MALSTSVTRPLQIVLRIMQWCSAVVVMGLTSYFVHKGPHGQHILYQEVISVLSVVFFLPGFVSPFIHSALAKFVFSIDVIFSYLWLTAFIFAAQDYDWHSCYAHAPPGVTCTRKRANQAFMFLTFFFTFLGMFLEVFSHRAKKKENAAVEKTDGSRAPLDAPVETTGAAAV